MPRKRAAKSKGAKKVNQQNTKNRTLSLVETLEKEFKSIPAKLKIQLHKDIQASKVQEKKAKAELKKAQAQKKIVKNKRITLTTKAKQSPSAANKKQLLAAKNAYDTVSKSILAITAKLEQTKNDTKALSQKQSKFASLSKEILRLEKDFSKNVIKTTISEKTQKESQKESKKLSKKSGKSVKKNVNHLTPALPEDSTELPEAIQPSAAPSELNESIELNS